MGIAALEDKISFDYGVGTKNCASVSALAEELGVHRTVLYHWQRQLEAGHDWTPTSSIRQLRKEVRDLKRVLAEKTLEADFFQHADDRRHCSNC